MWHTYHAPRTVAEALELLAQHGDACRLIAGGTDLILEIERGVRKQQIIVDISRIVELGALERRNGTLTLGALVTHNQVVGTSEAVAHAFPLARACWLVGAPQIRNRGTVAGNCITASPANDTIAPLWAMDATFTLASRDRGERTLTCAEFFRGVRKTALQPDEMLVRINVPALKPTERGTFLKLGLRQAQAISVVNVAVIVDFGDEDASRSTHHVSRARIALGSVAPTIVRGGGSRGLSRRQGADRRGHRPRRRTDRGRRPSHLRRARGRRLPPRHGARADRVGFAPIARWHGTGGLAGAAGVVAGVRGQGTGVRDAGVRGQESA